MKFKEFFIKNWPVIILLILAVLTHFLFLGKPHEVVFDEFWFGQFITSYFTHQYYFDIHPPLGKLIIFFSAKILGFQGSLDFSDTSKLLNADIFILRFTPALFGVLFVLLIYFIILKIGLSRRSAFLGASLIIFDNAILAQSRFILIDIFLLFFGFLSFYFLICMRAIPINTKKYYMFLIFSVIFSCFAFSIKWTGLSFYTIIFLFIFFDTLKDTILWHIVLKIIILIILPFFIYYSIFILHFNILYKSGPGIIYINENFQKTILRDTIQNNTTFLPKLQKFIVLNFDMFKYNISAPSYQSNASKWYYWPLDKGLIKYWTKSYDGKRADIFLLGNPLVWLSVLFSIIFSFIALFTKSFRKIMPKIFNLLIFGYLLNLLPFIFIDRATFLYHYFSSLIFGILILVVLYDKLLYKKKYSVFYYSAYLFGIICIFLLISPLTYGFFMPLDINDYYNNFIKFFL